jgi:hypothetical protein
MAYTITGDLAGLIPTEKQLNYPRVLSIGRNIGSPDLVCPHRTLLIYFQT